MRPGLVHCSLIATFCNWVSDIILQSSSHVALLILIFASLDIKDQSITRYFLILFDFDDVSSLDVLPLSKLKALAFLLEYKLFDWLFVYDYFSLFQFIVVENVD